MTRALIADDERLMREQLRARLAEVWPELEIVAEAKNGVDAARQIAQLPTDEDAAGWPGCEVVFITAYDQYAVEAFEQGVVDYVLKPAERERLQVTVERIRKRLAQRQETAEPPPSAGADMQQLLHKLAGQLNP